MDCHAQEHSTEDFRISPRALTLDDFRKYMETDIKPTLSNLKNDVELLADQVSLNKDDISDMRKYIRNLQKRESVQSSDHEKMRYDFVRRSLRLWPVKGSDDESLWSNTGIFIHDTMGVPRDKMEEELIAEIRRVRTARNSGARDEVLVIFKEIEARDTVASYARNLGSHMKDGRATAGMRTEVPNHLRGVYNVL